MRTYYQQGSWKDEPGFTNSQVFKGQILSQTRRDFTIGPYLTRAVLFEYFAVTAYP